MNGTDPARDYRHRLPTRLWHWAAALAVFILLMSGLTISNAHPHLYWGQYGANFDRAWLNLPHFPGWMTIPAHYSLALARRWHFTFAWVLVAVSLAYFAWGLLSRHFARDIVPSRAELAPKRLLEDFRHHLRLEFDVPGQAYNPTQKIAYTILLLVLVPLAILSGLALSPGMNAAWPWLLDLFQGRATARSIHFVTASAIAAFIAVHLLALVLAGPLAHVRAMITGWYARGEGVMR